MTRDKVVLTYKRKHAYSHSDPAHVNGGNTSSKSPKRVHASAAFNEQLEGDEKPTTQGILQSTVCVEKHDNAGEPVHLRVQELDKCKKCDSIQVFEKGLAEHSHSSSPRQETLEKAEPLSKCSDIAFVDSKSTFANGTPHTKGSAGSQSIDWHGTERSNPVSFNSTESKCTSLCREESVLKSSSGEKGFPIIEKPEMPFQETVHKERVGTPLRTFCRRAKKIKINETEVHNNLKGVRREGSAYEERRLLDVICNNEGPTDLSKEVPVLGQENKDSDNSSLNLNGKEMVKNLEEDASHETIHESLVENENDRSERSALHCTDGSSFIIKRAEFALEDTPVKFRSNCCSNDSMKKSSSERNRKDKQFKLPETGTLIGERVSKAGSSLSNLCSSAGCRSDINLNELASNKITANSLYETSKLMDCEKLLDSQVSYNCAVDEANGSGKALEPLETVERQKERVLCTSMQEADINCRLAFSEGDTSYQMPVNSCPPDPTVPQMQDFLRDTTNQTASNKGNFVRNIGDSMLESQWGTQSTRTICTDFLGSIRTQPETTVDSTRNYHSIAQISSLKGTDHIHDLQLPCKVSDSNSSIFRHKQILDDIITSSRMFNKRQVYYLGNRRKYSGVWSEEELDSLWIGVRRHGRGNWNAMLEDAKLHFAGWRIAEDLAERWDMEQARLLSAPSVQPVRSLELDYSPSPIISSRLLSNSAVDSPLSSYLAEFQNLRNETRLSLGGEYLKKEGKITNKNATQLSDFTVHPLAANVSLGAGSSYNYKSHQGHSLSTNAGMGYQRPIKAQNRDDLGSNLLEQSSVERLPGGGHQMAALSASTNLPHWLKEVLRTPATPVEPALLSSISTFEHSMISHSGDQRAVPPFSYPAEQLAPQKDGRRGILKRRGTSLNGASILGLSTLKSTESKVSDPNILDLNRSSLEAIEQKNLVILDSDASSEETISDDQSSRR